MSMFRERVTREEKDYDGSVRRAYEVNRWRWEVIAPVAALGCLVALFVLLTAFKAFSRYQRTADANNRVKVTHINIRNAQQQAQVVRAQNAAVKARAEQRLIEAVGIRNAQDEISATLTPLYLQHEAIKAQQAIATSPSNSVIYVPTGNMGVPLIRDTSKDTTPSAP